MVGLALFLTLFVMAPVADRIYDDAYLPFSKQQISQDEALNARERADQGVHAAGRRASPTSRCS